MSDSRIEPIGGYFELELQYKSGHFHSGLHFNSGRSCLAHALIRSKARRLYLPYYICQSVLEPLRFHNIKYEYYRIDSNFEIAEKMSVDEGEKLLYVNYFGLKEAYLESLIQEFSSSLIIDNTQDFFAKPAAGIDTFYSARKFFGVPDGGYLFPADDSFNSNIDRSSSLDKCAHLIGRMVNGPQRHYQDYLANESAFKYAGIKRMSVLSERMLNSIDYDDVMAKRKDNYLYIHNSLSRYNNIYLQDAAIRGPMCYPLLVYKDGLREALIKEQVFVPQFWREVLKHNLNADSPEVVFAKYILPLPIDQRYSYVHMDRIINIIEAAV